MERMGGTLTSLLLTRTGAHYGAGIELCLSLLADVAGGLAYLHARGIIHADVKPDNVLLTAVTPRSPHPTAKLADFGSSLRRREGSLTHATVVGERGTWLYMDPCLLDGRGIRPASDVYSFGVLAWHVLTGQVPYAAELCPLPLLTAAQWQAALQRHVGDGNRPPVAALMERGVAPDVVALVQSCWAPTQEARPTMQHVYRTLIAAVAALAGGGAAAAAAAAAAGGGPPPLRALSSRSFSASLLFPSPSAASSPSDASMHKTPPTSPPASRPVSGFGLTGTGLADELSAAIASRNVSLVVTLLDIVAHVSANDARKRAAQDGGSAAVVAALRAFPKDARVACTGCNALRTLSREVRQDMPDGGGTMPVADASRAVAAALSAHSDNLDVAQFACGVINNLAVAPDNRVLLVRDAAVEGVVVDALLDHVHNKPLALVACRALLLLALAVTNRVPLERARAGRALVAALRYHASDAGGAGIACNALWCLTAADDNKVPLLQRDNAGAALVAARSARPRDLQVARDVCRALSNLAMAPENQVPLVRDDDAGGAVAAAMVEHTGDKAVAHAGCHALAHLSIADATRGALVADAHAHAALVGAVRAHPDNMDVAAMACQALAHLAAAADNVAPLLSVGAIDVVVGILRKCTDRLEVVLDALAALAALAPSGADKAALMAAPGVEQVIREAVTLYVSNDAVFSRACVFFQ